MGPILWELPGNSPRAPTVLHPAFVPTAPALTFLSRAVHGVRILSPPHGDALFSLTLGLHRGQSPSSLQVKELIMDQVLPVGDHNPW